MGIIVLSCFDGISGTQQALLNLGITPEAYYSSEIDKYAIQITQKNFPNTIQLGDVTKWKEWNIDWKSIDLVTGGFPCQSHSSAGLQKGFEDPRGQLFFDLLNILDHLNKENPNIKFLFENVASMKIKTKIEITEMLRKIVPNHNINLLEIDSALVSAQSRKRLYWTNIENVAQPDNKNIFLKDIIESGDVDRLKAYCIDANYFKGTNIKTYLGKAKRQVVFEPKENYIQYDISGKGHDSQDQRAYYLDGKHGTLASTSASSKCKVALHTKEEVLCVAQRGRYYDENGKRTEKKIGKTTQTLEARSDGKTNCLSTVQKDNYIYQDFNIRKLTPIEAERLQTYPDGYTALGINDKGIEVKISDTQRYKALGNSFTIEVISHILKNI